MHQKIIRFGVPLVAVALTLGTFGGAATASTSARRNRRTRLRTKVRSPAETPSSAST